LTQIQTGIYLIAALVTIVAFYIQGEEFIRSMVRAQIVQSVLIAAISFIIGTIEASLDFFILGVLIIILRGFLISYFLEQRIPGKSSIKYEPNVNLAYYFLLDLVFIVISVFIIFYVVFSSFRVSGVLAGTDVLVFPLTLFFQGLFLIASRKSTFTQIIGYVEEENGLVLFAIFLIPVPLIIEASVFLDVLALVVITSIVVVEKQTHEKMEELKG
jgi:hydrogenase-4 component E